MFRGKIMRISASILSADFLHLKDDIDRAEKAGCDYIHIDIMDGHFVPNLAIGLCTVESLKAVNKLRKDVHLMIAQPERFIDKFAEAGADSIIFHAESCPHYFRLIEQIKKQGKLTGIALTSETPVETIRYVLGEVDIVLQVSVNVGFGGQKIIKQTYEKLKTLSEYKERYGYRFEIQTDGGISTETYKDVLGSGADVLVAGSMLFKAPDMSEVVRKIREYNVSK
jgi:ribulose-phosphate 3-epimerase